MKAGWLHRQSSVLHRWKKNWFVLYRSGELVYFASQDAHQAGDKWVVCATCLSIKTGASCDMTPPDGRTKDCLLHLVMRQEDLKLCAESPDDTKAWQIALEEARVMNRAGTRDTALPPGAQVVYPQAVSSYPSYVLAAPGQYVVHNVGGGSSTVVMSDRPGQAICMRQPYRDGYYGPYYSGMCYTPLLWW